MKRLFISALVAFLCACGARSAHPETLEIESLRARLEPRVDDASAQRELAVAEWLMPGGDAQKLALAVQRGLQARPDDAMLLMIDSVLAGERGDTPTRLAKRLSALESLTNRADPQAQMFAEPMIDELLRDARTLHEFDVVEGMLERIVQSPNVPADARLFARLAQVSQALRRGDLNVARDRATFAHCVSPWRVAGPFGPRELLSFDDTQPAQGAGPFGANEYDLGPGRGREPVRLVAPRGCAANLGSVNKPLGGTTIAEGFVSVQNAGPHLVRIETPNAFELWIDGALVRRGDSRVAPTPRIVLISHEFSAGEHEIEIKLASRHANPVLSVSLFALQPRDGAQGLAGISDPFAPPTPVFDGASVWMNTPSGLFARAQLARMRGFTVGAREALRALGSESNQTAAVLALRAQLVTSDPMLPPSVRRDEERRLIALTLERDPVRPLLEGRRAELNAADGQSVEALAAFGRIAAAYPDNLELQLARIAMLREHDWDAEAERALEQVNARFGDACVVKREMFNRERTHHRFESANRLLTDLMLCDARAYTRLQFLIATRNWEAAKTELSRLEQFEPTQQHSTILSLRLELARGQLDEAAILALTNALVEALPRSSGTRLAQADYYFAGGDVERARGLLTEASEADPVAMAPTLWVRRALGASDELAPYRRNGAQILSEFKASGRTYDAPQVLVFDYSATRVHRDGSSVSIVHQIYRAQSDEAVDDLGEFEVPSDARLLTLHTIKDDGRVLEPSAIAGKSSYSLPSLAVGDYVEIEYVTMEEAPTGFPGGYIGDRFYFQSFEVPFDTSQQVVVMPASMPYVIDPRGPAPEVVETRAGEDRVLTFTVHESRAREPEAGSVSAKEFLPSVRIAVAATWQALASGMRDALVDRSPSDPAAKRVVDEVLGDLASSDGWIKAQRLYAWVLQNIEPTDDFFGFAPSMIAARSGHRARVLSYLLTLADVPNELAAARSFYGDATMSDVADADTYSTALVHVHVDGREAWLSTTDRGVPFGYLPAGLRGQNAILLVGDSPTVTLPEDSVGLDRSRIEIDVTTGANGRARFDVVETFHGRMAIGWRNDLDGIAAAELPRRFEEVYVARLVPGAVLASLDVTGREDPEAPLTLRYSFDVADLGRVVDQRRLVSALYPSRLSQGFATRAQRATTLLLPSSVDTHVVVRVHGSDASRITALPPTSIMGPNGSRHEQRSSVDGDTFVIDRHVVVPMQRIAPEQYANFALFCREADQAENVEISLPLQ